MNILRNALFLGLAASIATLGAHASDTSKVNGSITAAAGQAVGDLETVNGGITIEAGATTGDAETVNGSIRVGDNARTGGLETVNGSIRIGRGVQVDGDMETVNGSLFADRGSQVRGDIENVNGSIGLVASRVGGTVETVNADITVGIDSHVAGGLRVVRPKGNFNLLPKRDPRIVIGPNVVVEGPLVFERPVKLYVHRSARTGPVTGATPQVFDTPVAPKD